MLPFASTIAFWSMTSGVIKGPTGLFISFPNRTQSQGGQPDIAFPVNAEREE
jgi:DNA-binding cell septation regulator SpoVG